MAGAPQGSAHGPAQRGMAARAGDQKPAAPWLLPGKRSPSAFLQRAPRSKTRGVRSTAPSGQAPEPQPGASKPWVLGPQLVLVFPGRAREAGKQRGLPALKPGLGCVDGALLGNHGENSAPARGEATPGLPPRGEGRRPAAPETPALAGSLLDFAQGCGSPPFVHGARHGFQGK